MWFVLACGAILVGLDDPDSKSPAAPRATHSVESALVTLIEEASIPARSNGVLDSIPVKAGQLVEPEAPLAQLDEAEATLAVERVTQEVEVARKQAASDVKLRSARRAFDVAKRNLKRAEESNDRRKDSVSEAELDALSFKAFNAELEVEQATNDRAIAETTLQLRQVELRQAELALSLRRIEAPFAGMVVQVHQQAGEWAEAGKPLVRIVRLDRLRVEGFFKSHEVDESLVGRRALLTVDLPGRRGVRFDGGVTFVSPEVNPVNGQVRLWAEVDNPGLKLRPGVRGRLEILEDAPPTQRSE